MEEYNMEQEMNMAKIWRDLRKNEGEEEDRGELSED